MASSNTSSAPRQQRQQRTSKGRNLVVLVCFTAAVLIGTWITLLQVPESSESDAYLTKQVARQPFWKKEHAKLHVMQAPGRDTQNVAIVSTRIDREHPLGNPKDQSKRHQEKQEKQHPPKRVRGVQTAPKSEAENRMVRPPTTREQRLLEGERQKNTNVGGPHQRLLDYNYLTSTLNKFDRAVIENRNGGIRWTRPELLVSMDPTRPNPLLGNAPNIDLRTIREFEATRNQDFFVVHRLKSKKSSKTPMAWELKPEATKHTPPRVDYTKQSLYEYPELQSEPPSNGGYPQMKTFRELMREWPQDDIDNPPIPYRETLIHFDYSNPEELEAAARFRDAELPFKLYNVPEITEATAKWTDEYIHAQFDDSHDDATPQVKGSCQESTDNFFAFFITSQWAVDLLGLPPTRVNDWTYSKWAQHARYADTVGLDFDKPHFYWQAGVDREERMKPKSQWSFISRDLPSFSSPTETFFVFHPESQKGIQCRFGERGVTAATHFDAGRNMVAMVTGAKRYILSPPNQCSKLGIVQSPGSPVYRHSLLNFGHLNHMGDHNATISAKEEMTQNNDKPSGMSPEEYAWLKRAGEASVVDTVLKAGEVLYIPSHWFHYITSLQKSAQCNVRSGVHLEGTEEFGGARDVATELCQPW